MILTFPFVFTVIVYGPTKLVTKPVAPARFQSAAVTVRVHRPTRVFGIALASVSVALATGTDPAATATTIAKHHQAALRQRLPMANAPLGTD
jgi:hypothetical protein